MMWEINELIKFKIKNKINKKIKSKKVKLIIRGSLNKFPDFFRMGTFIDSRHMKL